jgi:ABC-2 type transport system permease protein
MVAKVIVPALFSLALSIVCLAATYLVGWLFVRNKLETPAMSADVFRVMVGCALYAVGFCVIGVGLTALFRNQVAGIVSMLVVPLVVENAISIGLQLIPWFNRIETWNRYLPFYAGRSMYAPPDSVVTQFDVDSLSPFAGGAVFFAFGAIICALGILRFNKRDA